MSLQASPAATGHPSLDEPFRTEPGSIKLLAQDPRRHHEEIAQPAGAATGQRERP